MAEGTVSAVASEVEYRDIEGFPGYRVGNDGSVWSDKRGKKRRLSPGIVKGYEQVVLYRNSERHQLKVHTLVLAAFKGACPPGHECCHEDGKPLNNVASNLYWGTREKNSSDRFRHGTDCSGERNGLAKLTDQAVFEMRVAYAALKTTVPQLARRYGLTAKNIRFALMGRTWRHVGGPLKEH